MGAVPLEELNHFPSRAAARVRAGETVVLTEHGKPVISMLPAVEPVSAMPELIDDLAALPSLSALLIAERDEERGQ